MSEDGKIHFDHPGYVRYLGEWVAYSSDVEGGRIPFASLVGKKVNIGDKDGGVYEGVTVTKAEGGELTVEGGAYGVRFQDEEARPFDGTRTILAYDIARGYIHPDPEASS